MLTHHYDVYRIKCVKPQELHFGATVFDRQVTRPEKAALCDLPGRDLTISSTHQTL